MGNLLSSSKRDSSRKKSSKSNFQKTKTNFYSIADEFTSREQVVDALRREGLESSNLIVAVDFTKSNEWTGKLSNNGRCLHHLPSYDGSNVGPYEDVMRIIGSTLSQFDDDNLIPCYGFGDVSTQDTSVFSFYPDDKPAAGMDGAVQRYRDLLPHVKLAGPTSFAPAIYQAMRVVSGSGNQYHILLIIADGQVTHPSGQSRYELSVQEADTVAAIEAASHLPLSIIMVGVGDGPWDMMNHFDDQLPKRRFDNFQFVNFTEVAKRYKHDISKKEATFALNALMELPQQYKLIQKMGMLNASYLPPVTPHVIAAPKNPPAIPAMNANNARCDAGGNNSNRYPMGATVPSNYNGSSSNNMQPSRAPFTSSQATTYPAVLMEGEGVMGQFQAAVTPPKPDNMFLCPITQEVMDDPVVCSDGYSYERRVILSWMGQKAVSPMTNQPMDTKIFPNHSLRSSIMEWKQSTLC